MTRLFKKYRGDGSISSFFSPTKDNNSNTCAVFGCTLMGKLESKSRWNRSLSQRNNVTITNMHHKYNNSRSIYPVITRINKYRINPPLYLLKFEQNFSRSTRVEKHTRIYHRDTSREDISSAEKTCPDLGGNLKQAYIYSLVSTFYIRVTFRLVRT